MHTPRMTVSAVVAAALLGLLALLAPHQLLIVLYKLALVILAGVAGYWLDRALFPYARPHVSRTPINGKQMAVGGDVLPYVAAQIRRALIVAACMVAVGLGL